MKKISILSTLAACALALPLSAAVLNQATNLSGEGSTSSRKTDVNVGGSASGSGAAGGNSGALNSAGNAQVHRDGNSGSASMEATVDGNGNINRSAQRRIEDRVHKDYRSFAKRLNKVETRLVEEAKKGKNWTREQVEERRQRIQEIRAKLRDKADRAKERISEQEKRSLEAEVMAEERAVANANND